MGRPERPLDPHAGPVERLAWELRGLRDRAGRPSYRELAARAHFSRSTLAEAATGLRLPSLEATLAYATACGGDAAGWEARWRTAAKELERSRRRCPYPGLAPLEAADADLFFGRDDLVEQVRAAVARGPLTAVFGASGSGKSSLLRAGLAPALTAEGVPVAVLMPGAHPRAPLDEAVESLGPDGVLVVDQFEEAFTLCADAGERAEFLDAVAALADGGGPRVVLGVRGDFYGHCSRHAGLVAALRAGAQLPIGPLTARELRAVIVEPAARVGMEVEPALVEAVLAEAEGEPGTLPLVAHALRESWRRQPGQVLRLADYRAAGGVREAVARTAEELHGDLDPPQRDLLRAVFLRLAALGEGTEDTRRRVDRDELAGLADPGEIDALLDRLAAARLVVVDRGTAEPAHEALIDAWPRLRGWLADDRAALLRHRRLTSAADDWHAHDRDAEFLLRGGRLAEWDEADPGPLNERERAFLAAGRARRDAERAAERRRARRRFGGLSLVAAVVAVLAVVALVQADRNADARDRARSRQLAAEARRQFALDPALALSLAAESHRVAPTVEADTVLRQALADARHRPAPATGLTIVTGMAAAPDRTRIAVWGPGRGGETSVRTWRWENGRLVPDGPGLEIPTLVNDAAFGTDGRTLAVGSGKGAVEVWDASGGRGRIRKLWEEGGSPGKTVVAFAGGRVAAARGKEVRVWDLAEPDRAFVRLGAARDVDAVALSPDGRQLVCGGFGLAQRMFTLTRTGAEPLRTALDSRPTDLAFSPSGAWMVSTQGREARLWRTDREAGRGDWQAEATWRMGVEPFRGAVFSTDGDRVATFADDHAVRVWDTGSTLDPLTLRIPSGVLRAVAFAPDGRGLAGVTGQGALHVWDVTAGTGERSARLEAHDGMADRSLSADGGRVLATSAKSDRFAVWDAGRGGRPIADRRVPPGQADYAVLSPDGRRAATGGFFGAPVRLWDLAGGPPHVLMESGARTTALAFGGDGRTLAVNSGGADDVRVWRVPPQGPPTEVTGWRRVREGGRADGGLAVSADGRRLASARGDGSVWLWDLSGRARPRVLRGVRSTVAELALSRDGRWLAGACADGTVLLWDTAADGAAAAVMRGTGGEVLQGRSLAFTADGSWLAATEPSGGLRVWRVGEGSAEPLTFGGLGGPVGPLTFDGTRLVTAFTGQVGSDGASRWRWPSRVRAWECEVCGPADRLPALVRRHTPRPFTPDERRLYLRP
ncbi:hypothetical protein AB0J52_15380 [Spirillospora sp. NPDC049652]